MPMPMPTLKWGPALPGCTLGVGSGGGVGASSTSAAGTTESSPHSSGPSSESTVRMGGGRKPGEGRGGRLRASGESSLHVLPRRCRLRECEGRSSSEASLPKERGLSSAGGTSIARGRRCGEGTTGASSPVAAELPCSFMEATASREKTRRSKWSDPVFGMERFMGLLPGSSSGLRDGRWSVDMLVFPSNSALCETAVSRSLRFLGSREGTNSQLKSSCLHPIWTDVASA